MTNRMDVPVDIGGTEIVLDVTYTYRSGVAARMNIWPPEPAESAELEIVDIMAGVNSPVPMWFFQAVAETVSEYIFDHHESGIGPDPDAERDRRLDEADYARESKGE